MAVRPFPWWPVLDCEFAPLSSVYFEDALKGGLRYVPSHRHRDTHGNTRFGKIRFTGKCIENTTLRDVRWKKDINAFHYEYSPDTDTHNFFFTGPNLPPVIEGGQCNDIQLDQVADSWPVGLETWGNTFKVGDFSKHPGITINPKVMGPNYLPNTTGYPGNVDGGWFTTTTTARTTSSVTVDMGSSAFDGAAGIDMGFNNKSLQHTSGYIDTVTNTNFDLNYGKKPIPKNIKIREVGV